MSPLDPLAATISLSEVAHGRSGDKGNHANVAVIAYTPEGHAWLRQRLTAEVVREHFAALSPSKVIRYEAPNLLALNFVLYDVLAGGASRSLRADTQGKTLALALLELRLERPEGLAAMLRPAPRSPS
jgi:hypothetical protein